MAGIGIMVMFLVLVFLTVPVAFSMGIASFFSLLISGLPVGQIPGRTVVGMDSYTYLAIPMFILAGSFMETGGIASRLVKFATVLVGHFKGGLAMVVVVAEMLFSGISGSTVADVSAMSAMMLPSMKRAKYKPDYSVSVISAASAMGILIPPCILMVALAAIANESVGALFLAGFLPAFFMGGLLLIFISIQARKYGFPAGDRATAIEIFRAFADSMISLGMPVIIFGGILTGIATATEIAAVAVIYSLIVGVFIYREIKILQIWKILVDCAINTTAVMLLVGFANIFCYVLALSRVPELITSFFLAISASPIVFMIGASLVLIIVGSVLEGVPAAIIFTPVFLPVVKQFEVVELHFLIVMVASIGIGLFIPPAGIGLVIGARIGNVPMESIMKSFYPFILVLFIGLVGLIIFPEISTFVPDKLMPK